MMIGRPETIDQDREGKEKEVATPQAKAGEEDVCRCKEVSEMSARELLALMMNDLAFWKKGKKA